MKHVQTASIKSRSPNRLVTLIWLCDLFVDRKRVSDIVCQATITNNTESFAFTEKTFRECLYRAAIAESNGYQNSQQRSSKMLWKKRKYYSKRLVSLNSSVTDDNYDTYKIAIIEINQLSFLND
jgi:hypothetical protein